MKRQALFVRQQKEGTTLSSPKNKSGHYPRLRYGRVPPRATEQRVRSFLDPEIQNQWGELTTFLRAAKRQLGIPIRPLPQRKAAHLPDHTSARKAWQLSTVRKSEHSGLQRRQRDKVFPNAFTSAFKELDPVPQFKATAKLGEFLEARFSQSF
jgi:hypothetical protein